MQITPKVAFIVFGVHKDGLLDPLGTPFIDDALIAAAKSALHEANVELIEHDVILATKAEAKACLNKFKKLDDLDAIVLFSGTWVWAAHLVAALRDFATTGKGIVLWTNPGSQGWRPVGGLVMHGGLKEVGIPHRFVYGGYDDPRAIERITAYCRASALVNRLNMSTVGAFGGRGMGQTCGVADPSQWLRVFGVDIDSRDTTLLIETARAVTPVEVQAARAHIQPSFSVPIPDDAASERSLRLYVALKKLVAQEGWDFYTIQSFPGLGDDYSATCFAQSMMVQDGVPTATLSDFNTTMSVKLLMDLSGERVYYGDLQHIDKGRARSRSSATARARRGWPARWSRPALPSTASRPRARRAACPSNSRAGPVRGCWPGSAAAAASSSWSSPAARLPSRMTPRNWPGARPSAASPSGRTPSSPLSAISTRYSRRGTTSTPSWATAPTCTRI